MDAASFTTASAQLTATLLAPLQVLLTVLGVLPVLLTVSDMRGKSQAAAIGLNNFLDEYATFARSARLATAENGEWQVLILEEPTYKWSEERGVMLGAQGRIVDEMVDDLLVFVPVFYAFAAVIALRLVHFCVGYMYTLAVKDACRSHVANVGVRAVEGAAQQRYSSYQTHSTADSSAMT